MKKWTSRTLCAGLLGAGLAIGSVAVAAVPANAANVTISIPSTSSKDVTLPSGTWFAPTATYAFSHPVTSYRYVYGTLNRSINNSGTTTGTTYTHDGHTFQFPMDGLNRMPYTYTNTRGERVTITAGENLSGGNHQFGNVMEVTVQPTAPVTSATVHALATIDKGPDATGSYWFGLHGHVSASDGLGGTQSGDTNATYFNVTWQAPAPEPEPEPDPELPVDPPIVDTPIIAPAIAGIALLGAAAVGGGRIALKRLRK